MRAFLPLALLVLAGCTPWRAEYLGGVQGHATQDEVAQRMGGPTKTIKLKNGGDVWTYTLCSCGSEYIEYVLTFDQSGVLRAWQRQ